MSEYLGERRPFTFRFPEHLAKRVEAAAKKEGISINAYITRELEKQVTKDEKRKAA